MDHVAALDVDDSLVPPVYVALGLWHEGSRREAAETLARSLADRLGGEVLGDVTPLTDRGGDGFAGLLQRLFREPLALSQPPAAVAAAVWRQIPRNEVLRALFLGDLRWSYDPFETADTVPEADVLTALLRHHEAVGLLSRDAADVAFGGRPVLSGELLAAARGEALGAVHDELVTPAAAPTPAAEWWPAVAGGAPRFVLRTFLHDAYVAEDGRSGEPSATWDRVRERHGAYATAVRDAWAAVAADIGPQDWSDVARFVALTPGRPVRDEIGDLLAG